ncbi:Alcohol dehydrogenase [acceptor] [Variovorax sp. PBL-H6]|uniref:GMC family oxidoreductase n=1 Tax=Variovorax sp. PBL-H6 TaxID=434009 RepID=UPI00131944BC|nr:GMC family oxidoreductase N-terminal domain-containing protein [Variovorax sp. PBL-H6]VTU25740.1 Alcohol dehydrogenase [acceptor] [Variovorax sp. PBL-H6]
MTGAPSSMEAYDYIVVGAGSAGCVLAARLTESGRHRVLLLEGGGADNHMWIHIPLGVGKLLTDERYAWKFQTEPQAAMQGQSIYWPRGKVLGGSSALNGMAYVWGDPREYDGWTGRGIEGWRFEQLLPYFKRLESNPFADNPLRGHDGPMRITDRAVRERDTISEAFVHACGEAGIESTPDYNAVRYEGVRYLEQTAHNGRRWSAAVAYLKPARQRSNLIVRTGSIVRRVLLEGQRCVGVEFEHEGRIQTARARCEVVLSAGAVQSPQLLELSGIGDAARLQALGIAVQCDLPSVGEHMSDHLQVRCTYRTRVPETINDLMRSPYVKVKTALQYLFLRKGLLANTSSTAHAITRTASANGHPDVMIRVYHISGKDRYSRTKGAGIDPWSGFSIGGFVLYPASRGSIHCASADPNAPPRIQPNYLAEDADRRATVDLLKLVRRIANQASLGEVVIAEQRPGAGAATDAALLDYARESGQTAWHTVGTCRMGRDSTDSVLDSRLRVHGIAGLRVADASVMPTIASSNTNAPALMIGEKASEMLLADSAKW